ncbi:hypothetical protein PY365_21655 [Roseiarcaceae bacterium H3SJ34-1]|uniref:hypothetical protein n=1 Tax=Terripilifer ovatus TaxID=3032367 RepID=UPI003AB97FA2|nr:hypothetical protein [Roseiarcaceae bacterium H3SJ34-1]
MKRVKRASEGFHTWTVAEIEQYLAYHGSGTMARMALYLMLFLGPRLSDAIKLGRGNL